MKVGKNNKIFAYMRISTQKDKQKMDRQRHEIEEYAKKNKFMVDEFFEERISGSSKPTNRKEYSRMREKLRSGDVVVFCDLDRLARNQEFILDELRALSDLGVRYVIFDVSHLSNWEDTQREDDDVRQMQQLFLMMQAYAAERELKNIRKKVAQGVATARDSGKTLGRPKTGVPDSFRKDYSSFKAGEYGKASIPKFCKMLGIAESTYYKYQKLLEQEKLS